MEYEFEPPTHSDNVTKSHTVTVPRERCPTCGWDSPITPPGQATGLCTDPWHGTPTVPRDETDAKVIRQQLMKAEWPHGGHGTLDATLAALDRILAELQEVKGENRELALGALRDDAKLAEAERRIDQLECPDEMCHPDHPHSGLIASQQTEITSLCEQLEEARVLLDNAAWSLGAALNSQQVQARVAIREFLARQSLTQPKETE